MVEYTNPYNPEIGNISALAPVGERSGLGFLGSFDVAYSCLDCVLACFIRFIYRPEVVLGAYVVKNGG